MDRIMLSGTQLTARSLRAAAVLFGVALFAAACGGSETSDNSSDDSSAPIGISFSVTAGLDALPTNDITDTFLVTVVDFDRAAAAVEAPPLEADADAAEWLVDQLFGRPVAEGGTGLRLLTPELLGGSFIDVEAVDDEFGWSIGALSAFAEVNMGPQRFTVLRADSGWPADLPVVAEGVRTIGDGDDGEAVVDARTVLRPLGRPLRVAERNGLLAGSLVTSDAAAWADGTYTSLAASADLEAIAAELDRAGVFQATIVRSSFVSRPPVELDPDIEDTEAALESVVDQPFATVAVGVASGDDTLQHVVVYDFATAESASAAAPQIEQIWTEGTTFEDRPLTDFMTNPSVTQNERRVIVVGTIPDTSVSISVLSLATVADRPFAHR